MISTVGWFQQYHPHGKHALHANIYILASLFRRGDGANITHMSATSQHLLHKGRWCRAIFLRAVAFLSIWTHSLVNSVGSMHFILASIADKYWTLKRERRAMYCNRRVQVFESIWCIRPT